jgi:hypothetical protein
MDKLAGGTGDTLKKAESSAPAPRAASAEGKRGSNEAPLSTGAKVAVGGVMLLGPFVVGAAGLALAALLYSIFAKDL